MVTDDDRLGLLGNQETFRTIGEVLGVVEERKGAEVGDAVETGVPCVRCHSGCP